MVEHLRFAERLFKVAACSQNGKLVVQLQSLIGKGIVFKSPLLTSMTGLSPELPAVNNRSKEYQDE